MDSVQVLDRAVLVVDTIARTGPLSLAELVRETELPRPTVYRLAVALEEHALLVRDAEGRFALGGKLTGWAAAAEHGLIARRPGKARSCTCVKVTGASASRATNGRVACATPFPSARCCHSLGARAERSSWRGPAMRHSSPTRDIFPITIFRSGCSTLVG